jgi:TnpA family transposase
LDRLQWLLWHGNVYMALQGVQGVEMDLDATVANASHATARKLLKAALRLGTADAESLLRRFTKSNVQHPIYKALCELGKALKTVFLCDYLRIESLRREIHEGLQLIEI